MHQPDLCRQQWLSTAIGLLLAAMSTMVGAQTALPSPSTEQMIEQLKSAPKTRGLRNLKVEANTETANASSTGVTGATPARPALSLLIQFDFNSAKVRPESQQALANLSQALLSSDLLASNFAVEGHTDAKGSPEYNLKLSQHRAEAIRDFLVSRGVQDTRLKASGKGASELANPGDPFAAENRRVRIVNLD
jgi:outer membrane protein OmpA-like peptidoglycan-associated protein